LNQNINSDIVYSLIKINLKTSNSTGSLSSWDVDPQSASESA